MLTYPPRSFRLNVSERAGIPSAVSALRRTGGTQAARRRWSRPLSFMHIPKSAGTAVACELKRMFLPEEIIGNCFDRSMFGAFDNYVSMERTLRTCIFDGPDRLPPGCSLVAGHLSYATLAAAYPEAELFTLLREPTARLLSLWLFWRQHTDADLAPWGTWADCVRLSRKSLETFAADPMVACQTDNVAVRMLLWPHGLIPDSGFIDPVNDRTLLRAATRRLATFNFVEIVENPNLHSKLQNWLGRPVNLKLKNETRRSPTQSPAPLHSELTPVAHNLLRKRTRLDARLWAAVGLKALSRPYLSDLRDETVLGCIARYAALMAG